MGGFFEKFLKGGIPVPPFLRRMGNPGKNFFFPAVSSGRKMLILSPVIHSLMRSFHEISILLPEILLFTQSSHCLDIHYGLRWPSACFLQNNCVLFCMITIICISVKFILCGNDVYFIHFTISWNEYDLWSSIWKVNIKSVFISLWWNRKVS